jgi:hypothetical protein
MAKITQNDMFPGRSDGQGGRFAINLSLLKFNVRAVINVNMEIPSIIRMKNWIFNAIPAPTYVIKKKSAATPRHTGR